MQIINLYKYIREGGGVTVSPIKPECEYTELYRIVADEAKVLVKDEVTTTCADVDSLEGWTEIDAPEETLLEEEEPTP